MPVVRDYDHPLEKHIHNRLLPLFHWIVSTDKKIVKLYNDKLVGGVDHYCRIGKYYVTIQDKSGRRNYTPQYRHFKDGTEHIKKHNKNRILLAAIYVSPRNLTGAAKEEMEYLNSITGDNKYIDLRPSKDHTDEEEMYKDMADVVYNTVLKLMRDTGITPACELPVSQFTNIMLREHQLEAIQSFNDLQSKGIKCSILSHPTGAGKTLTSLCIGGEYLLANPDMHILYICPRLEGLYCQFGRGDEISKDFQYARQFGYYNNHVVTKWFDSTSKIPDIIYDNDAPRQVIVTNVTKLLIDNNYLKLPMDKIQFIIFDECHSNGADKTYKMMKYFKNQGCNIVGVSATPVRAEQKKYNRTLDIYGSDGVMQYIDIISIVDAIERGFITRLKFKWIETKTNKDITTSQLKNGIEEDDILYYVSQVDATLAQDSKKHKAICWCTKIKNANRWYRTLLEYQKYKDSNGNLQFPELAKYTILLSHGGNDKHANVLSRYKLEGEYHMVICVGRAKEAFDDAPTDTCIDLDQIDNIGTVVFIQKIGRATRLCEGKEYGTIIQPFTIVDKQNKITELVERILKYPIFLNLCATIKNSNRLDIQSMIDSMQTDNNTIKFYDPNTGDENLSFEIISHSLQSFEWGDFSREFKARMAKNLDLKPFSYNEAKQKIAKEKCTTIDEYRKVALKYIRLPHDPENFYCSNGMFNWVDYLSIPCENFYDWNQVKKNFNVLLRDKNNNNINLSDVETVQKKLLELNPGCYPPIGLWKGYYPEYNTSDITKKSLRYYLV